jgi:hypothetical protein
MANPEWMPKWMKWTINRLDNPIDDLKHKLHGAKFTIPFLGEYRLRIACLMSNRDGKCSLTKLRTWKEVRNDRQR